MQRIVLRAASADEILTLGARQVRRAIASKDFLDPRFRRANERSGKPSHGTYNLYRGEGLFVSASGWGPGDHSDPHNHQTLGLIGVIDNAIQETRYRVAGTDASGAPKIDRAAASLLEAGDVAVLNPGVDEIHELDNFSQRPTVELHVYGQNLVGLDRYFFDRETGAARAFRSGKYDNC
jgi:predicted metal-dependent enzyme (double-stranded beta helix superfamily)